MLASSEHIRLADRGEDQFERIRLLESGVLERWAGERLALRRTMAKLPFEFNARWQIKNAIKRDLRRASPYGVLPTDIVGPMIEERLQRLEEKTKSGEPITTISVQGKDTLTGDDFTTELIVERDAETKNIIKVTAQEIGNNDHVISRSSIDLASKTTSLTLDFPGNRYASRDANPRIHNASLPEASATTFNLLADYVLSQTDESGQTD